MTGICELDLITDIVTCWLKKATSIWACPGLASIALTVGLLNNGCAYRFTNQYVSPPAGVRTIAVEAIYDTSREVLPHEMLWESLQQAFAKDGHLRLTSHSDADALVRAHVKSGSVLPAGGNIANDLNPTDSTTKVKDPTAFSTTAPPPVPSQFRRLTQAGEYRDKAAVNTVVEVEVWNLNTRALLFRKVYPTSSVFQAIHAIAAITTTANDHLRYDEAGRAAFKHMSDSVAYDVVNGLMRR